MDRTRQAWLRTAAALLVIGAAALLIWRMRDVVIIVLLAVVCAYVLRPLVTALIRPVLRIGGRSFRLSRGLAAGVVFITLGLILWAIWALSAPPLARQLADLQENYPRYRDSLRLYTEAGELYRNQLPTSFRTVVDSWTVGAGSLVSGAVSATFHGVGFLAELFLLPILTFYFLADGPGIRRQILTFLPRRYIHRTEYALDQADEILQGYIKAQIILCFIAFVVVTAGLWLLGVKFYLVLGLVAGLTRAVPIIGPVVGAIPIIIVVGLNRSLVYALWLLIPFALMHILESKLLMPAVLGRQLDLHPALIIVALLIGAEMGGLLGVFLAAPVLAALKVLVAQQRTSPHDAS